MKLYFEGKNETFFSTYKLTLKPGENVVADDVGAAILKAHESECNRGAVKTKPRIRLIEEKAEPAKSSGSSSGSVKEAAKSILGGGKDKGTASTKGEK